MKFLKESIPGVILATRGLTNLKMSKNRFFFIIQYLISRIFVIFFMHVKTFVFSLFSSPNNNFDVYWPFIPAKCKKTKNYFWSDKKENKNFIIILISFNFVTFTLMKLQIAITPVLVGQKYPSGDQIQGLDGSYPVDIIGWCFWLY